MAIVAPEKGFKRLENTRFFLGGALYLDLANPDVIELLKRVGIRKVFCLYPISGKMIQNMSEEARKKIDWSFVDKLRREKIGLRSIIRNPQSLLEYNEFVKEVKQVHKDSPVLIQCYAGRHGSGAYAYYYLAKETPLTRPQVDKIFIRSGFTGKDLISISGFFKFQGPGRTIDNVFAEKAAKIAKEQARKNKKKPKTIHDPGEKIRRRKRRR